MKLNVLDNIPNKLLELGPEELYTFLPGPTLIEIPGEQKNPLFISTLLHGNETTGFLALQRFLKNFKFQERSLPRSLIIFLGNIEAASRNLRRYPNQPDYNRLWNGGSSPEHEIAQQVLKIAKERKIFAAIDLHNSSGKNPHYACINKIDPSIIGLAKLYSSILVYFTLPKGVLSLTFSEFCPAITIESGLPGDLGGIAHVTEFIELCLNLRSIPEIHSEPKNIFLSKGRVTVPSGSKIGFNQECRNVDFCFLDNLDSMNFNLLPKDTLIGWRHNPNFKLSITNEYGDEVGEKYIYYDNKNEIRLKTSVTPSLFTTQPEIVHQDCLGYFMEHY